MSSAAGGDRTQPSTSLALGISALILAPTLAYRIGVDQGSFAYMGARLLEGGWPYVHSWENDFPGLVFIQALQMLALGKSVAMFRLFDVVVQLVNVFFIFRLGEKAGGRLSALIAAVAYCLIYQGYGPWNTAQREGFGLCLILLGFWAYDTRTRRAGWVTAVVIGLGMGTAVTIKPTLLALSLFYLPLVMDLRQKQAIALAAAAFAALLAPAAILIGGYWFAGHLQDMYDACIGYQEVYTARLRGTESLWSYWLGKLGRLGLNAKALVVGYVPFLFAGERKKERLMLWLGLVGAVYAVFVQGTYAGYHYLPGLAIGAILAGCAFTTVTRAIVNRIISAAGLRRRFEVAIVSVALVGAGTFYMRRAPVRDLVTLHFLQPPRPNEFRNSTVFDFTESYDTAQYLKARTQPDQPIQIWGYESLTYYLAERRAASRFQMTHPLVMRPPGGDISTMQKEWRAEFIRDIEAQKPPYVAVVRNDRWWWAPDEKTSEELLRDFPEWQALILKQYSLETTIGRFAIYRRINGGTP